MKDSNELILGNIIKLTRLSEKKFKLGNFKGAIDDKMKANAILKSKSCDEKLLKNIEKNYLNCTPQNLILYSIISLKLMK